MLCQFIDIFRIHFKPVSKSHPHRIAFTKKFPCHGARCNINISAAKPHISTESCYPFLLRQYIDHSVFAIGIDFTAVRTRYAAYITGILNDCHLEAETNSEKRQIIAGVKSFYKKEELEGLNIVVVANLEPATIAGIESQAMLLAAKDPEGKYRLVTIDQSVEPGTKVE